MLGGYIQSGIGSRRAQCQLTTSPKAISQTTCRSMRFLRHPRISRINSTSSKRKRKKSILILILSTVSRSPRLGLLRDLLEMVSNLQPLSLHTTKLSMIQCSSNSKRSKTKRIHQRESNKLISISKTSPTPLIMYHKPQNQTKLEAVEAIVKDLEAASEKGIDVDAETFASLLETCYKLDAMQYCVRVHRLIPRRLLRRKLGLSTKLLRLYASCGYIEEAHQVFDKMPRRDVSAFAWNSLISGYTELGMYEDAMALYFQMEEEGVEPDLFTFPRVLKACGGIGFVQIGEAVHRNVVRSGFGGDVFVLNALVDMYAKCGDIVKARKVFDKIASKDKVSWNTMLSAYMRHELLLQALDIFQQMLKQGCQPDSVAVSTILSAVPSLEYVVQIHGWTIRQGVEWNLSTVNALIAAYSKHGKLNRACWLFGLMPERDVVTWNTIISAHSKSPKALMYFEEMESAGEMPDTVTFVSILSVCAHLGLVKDGERLFSTMKNVYRISPIMQHYACMVNLYGRAGLIKEAYGIIMERMEFEAGATVWGALLYACYLYGNVDIGEVAAERLFELEPDNEYNFELLMKIYGKVGRLEDVERVREMMVDRGLDS